MVTLLNHIGHNRDSIGQNSKNGRKSHIGHNSQK